MSSLSGPIVVGSLNGPIVVGGEKLTPGGLSGLAGVNGC